METVLRLVYLRFRYRLGFAALCREVTDSLSWRRLCRIPLGEAVPHPSTLEKICGRCGEEAVARLNELLVQRADELQALRLDKLRADTTMLPANVAYPTDSGLLSKGVARVAGLTKKLKALGLAARTTTRDRTRAVRRRAHQIGAFMRRRSDEAKREVLAITGEIASIAAESVAEAHAVARNARRSLARQGQAASGKALALLAELERIAAALEAIVAQTRVRLSGEAPDGASRIISLHDTDARPIAKGRLGRPVEFGYKAQLVDNAAGIVVDYELHKGNPPDAPLLAPAIARVKARFGRAPLAVTADRGYGEAAVEEQLRGLGVRTVAIPRKGRPGAARQRVERAAGLVRLVKWRTGCEGRISCLKRDFGWSRTLMDGEDGASTWAGWGIFSHNAKTISALVACGTGPPGRRRDTRSAAVHRSRRPSSPSPERPRAVGKRQEAPGGWGIGRRRATRARSSGGRRDGCSPHVTGFSAESN